MKKAFSTLAWMEAGWQEVLDAAVKAGMDAVEVRLDSQDRMFGVEKEELPAMLAAFAARKVAIRDIGTSIRPDKYDADLLEKAKGLIPLAACIPGKAMRIFLGSPKTQEPPEQSDWQGIVRFLQELADASKEAGVEIWIETHFNFSKGTVLRDVLNDVKRDNVKVLWDLMHPYEVGEMPEETLAALGKDIAHVHIKDGRKPDEAGQTEYFLTKLGEGTLPLKKMLCLLRDAGYDGCCSLEWERAWKPEIRDLYENLGQLLEDYNKFMADAEG